MWPAIKNDFSGTCTKGSEFVRENVTELDFELVHQGFELVEREVMFGMWSSTGHGEAVRRGPAIHKQTEPVS